MADYAQACRERRIFWIFDPGQSLPAWDGGDLARTIDKANVLISNDYELQLITNATGLTMPRLLEMVGTIVTTKADEGCEVVTQEGTVKIPAVPGAQVVDPTGAGDAFRGGFIKGLIDGCPVERAAQMGAVCGYYAVQGYGTQEYSMTMWTSLGRTLRDSYGG